MRPFFISLLITIISILPFNMLAIQYPQVDNISGYNGDEPYVYETSTSTWFVLNNEKEYEKWGIVVQAEYLNHLTTYSGKYALVQGVMYRYDNGWHSTLIEVKSFIKPSNGVYIIDKCGNPVNVSDFSSDHDNRDAVAVAVITDNMAAMISKRNVLGEEDVWNSGGESMPVIWGETGLVNGVMQTEANGSNAIPGAVMNDFAGYNNTLLINQALNNPTNSAVVMASNYVFENGIHGYLPAFGELKEVKINLSDVNYALALIEGKPLDGIYWSSSQHYLNYRAWWVQLGTGHDNNQHFAALRNNHTPLSSTYYNACYALLRPFGKLPDYTFENPYPETPLNTLLGDVNNDGLINIDDVVVLIDYLLTDDPSNINLQNADCEADGKISISDVAALIEFILPYAWPWETKTFTVNGVTFSMVNVQGGAFMMGATEEQGSDAVADEKPVHQVIVSSYGIGQTEVTQELWLAVMGSNPSCNTGDLKLPVEYVSWNLCQEFINRLNSLTGENFRLPTEAEWEFAARGGNKTKGYKYSGSDIIGEVAWYNGNASSRTHRVATKKANELGLYDMSGNVSEWCSDWYGNYKSDVQMNPYGEESGTYRVNRGGSWYDNDKLCRVSNREAWTPTSAAPFGTLGFRLAMDVKEDPLMLSENKVTLTKGSQCNVEILNGSGDYNVSCDDSIATAVINGSQLVVTGNSIGNTTIIITDNATHNSVSLYVAVVNSTIQNKTFTVNSVTFTMIAVEGGSFMMGATPEQGEPVRDAEKPVHEVTLSDYYIGQTEVTQELWQAIMGNNPSYFTGNLKRPVEQISWHDCQEFINKLNELSGQNFHLPTEAEWEFAARGGNKSLGYKYAGSDDIYAVAWWSGNSNESKPVATKVPNELGLFDMSGNVWEWCQDWSGDYSDEAQINPTGPTNGTSRINRGGAWSINPAWSCRVSNRNSSSPTNINSILGFRLAMGVKEDSSIM